MTNAERFVSLLVGILTVMGLIGACLRILLTISWNTAKLVEQFNDHVRDDDKIHDDIEARMRLIERGRRRFS